MGAYDRHVVVGAARVHGELTGHLCGAVLPVQP